MYRQKIIYIFCFSVGFFLYSCGMQDIGGAKVTGFAESSSTIKDVTSNDGDDRSYGVIEVGAAQKIKLSANSKSEIIGASVVFDPGTFSVSSVTVAIETGETHLYQAVIPDLNFSSGNIVTQAAPSVVVRPSTLVEVLVPFAVTVPLPGLGSGLFLTAEELYERLAVLYLVFDISGELKTGLYSYQDLELDAGKKFASFKTRKFGSFQAVLLERKEETKPEVVSTQKKEIKNKKGEVLIDETRVLKTYTPPEPNKPPVIEAPVERPEEWLEIDWTDTHTHVAEGSSTSFKVRLKFVPSSEVKVAVSLSHSEFAGLQDNLSELYFNSSNWDMPQTVSIQAKENDTYDGNINFELAFASFVIEDSRFSNRIEKHDNFYHYDNDYAALRLFDQNNVAIDHNYPGSETSESGANFSFYVQLSSKPRNNVTVKISVSDSSEAYLPAGMEELNFTSDNWNTSQSIYVMGQSDNNNDGDQYYQVKLSTSDSQDVMYQGLSSVHFDLKNTNIDFNLALNKLGKREVKNPKEGAVQVSDDSLSFYLLSKQGEGGDHGAIYKYDISALSNKQYSSQPEDLPSSFLPSLEKMGSSVELLGAGDFSFSQFADVFVIGSSNFAVKFLDLNTVGFSFKTGIDSTVSNALENNAYAVTSFRDERKVYIVDNTANSSKVKVLKINNSQELEFVESFPTNLTSAIDVQKIIVNERYLMVTAKTGGGAGNKGQFYVKNKQSGQYGLITATNSGEYFYSAQLYGDYAYICSDDKIHIYNISSVATSFYTASINVGCKINNNLFELLISGDYLFIGDKNNDKFYIYYLKGQETNPGLAVNIEMGLNHKAMRFLYIKHHLYVFGVDVNDLSQLTVFRNHSVNHSGGSQGTGN